MTSSGCFVAVDTVSNGDLASTKFAFTNKHILYGKLRPYLAKIGRPDFSGVCSTDILPILPGPKVDRGFLLHFLRQPRMVDYASSRTSGANLPRLSPKALAEFEIPLPPLSEQKRIADILDMADAIRRKRQEANQSASMIMHAVFSGLFKEGIRSCVAGKVPQNWTSTTINGLKASAENSCIGGPFGSDLIASDYVPEPGVPVIRGGNLSNDEPFMSDDNLVFVSEEKAEQLSKCSAFRGDVIVSQRGARLAGQVGVIPPDSAYDRYIVSQSQMNVAVDPKKLDPFFLVCYLQSAWAVREMERRAISTGVPHINLGILKSFPVYLPPAVLQHRFIRVWPAQQTLIKSTKVAATQSENLFNSLVQRAFRGGVVNEGVLLRLFRR
ncbi:MAG: restriction endonuclease subunit S [Planctomycetia bacterium]|nr:restriction endonuclease subunit S [Planctomycetia bacterium]